MKAIEIEVAIMRYFGIRQNIIVPNVFWGINGLYYECDIVKLTKSNYATEVEIKVSKSDIKRDKNKRYGHSSRLFKYLYFAVPEELIDYAITEIPEKAGLFAIRKRRAMYDFEKKPYSYKVIEVKKPKFRKNCLKWTAEQRQQLLRLGTMRILGLKEKLIECEN